MLNCAYCDSRCQPTREHVVPRWYNDTPGEAETFSARAPLTHRKGDLIVRDVCSGCNSGVLSSLDGYGKELYERYFANPVFDREKVVFEYDGERLLRWLLKLSYNSARAQNADARVLREYRKVMIGESTIPDRVRCWLHLVAGSIIDQEAKVIRPAHRVEQGQSNALLAKWFRIGQFRLFDFPALFLVQRMVVINSFSFTLMIAPAVGEWPQPQFYEWIRAFNANNPAAQPILPGVNSLTAFTGWDHAAVSMHALMNHFPTRYSDEPNPAVESALKGNLAMVMLQVTHELIEEGSVQPIVETLRDMVSSREKGLAFKQRVGVLVDGYDTDPRGLWQIPKVKAYFRRLFEQCPFVMFLSHPDGALLKLFAACYIYEEGMTEDVERQRMGLFLNQAFAGLNVLQHTLAISEEQIREINSASAKALFDEVPPMTD